jgi:hypothetical protein
MGQTSRTIKARHKKHIRHVHLEQPEKSVMVENWINTGYCINFNSTSILGMVIRYMDHPVREAIEIWLHPNNFKRDKEFTLSPTR